MIIALSIFIMTVLLAVNIYLIFNNTQRRTVAQQKVQDDMRYLFEAMAQEVRLGRINYNFYADLANGINLYPADDGNGSTVDGNNNYALSVINQAGEHVFFRRSSQAAGQNDGQGSKVQYCAVGDANDCDVTVDSNWQDVTPVGVRVTDLRFIITPTVDPFTEVGSGELPDSCSVSSPCPLGYTCQASSCHYFADGGNFQPKVRIVLSTESEDARIPAASRGLTMQTIISLRAAQGKIQNENYQ